MTGGDGVPSRTIAVVVPGKRSATRDLDRDEARRKGCPVRLGVPALPPAKGPGSGRDDSVFDAAVSQTRAILPPGHP